jgi:hypothetical protein
MASHNIATDTETVERPKIDRVKGKGLRLTIWTKTNERRKSAEGLKIDQIKGKYRRAIIQTIKLQKKRFAEGRKTDQVKGKDRRATIRTIKLQKRRSAESRKTDQVKGEDRRARDWAVEIQERRSVQRQENATSTLRIIGLKAAKIIYSALPVALGLVSTFKPKIRKSVSEAVYSTHRRVDLAALISRFSMLSIAPTLPDSGTTATAGPCGALGLPADSKTLPVDTTLGMAVTSATPATASTVDNRVQGVVIAPQPCLRSLKRIRAEMEGAETEDMDGCDPRPPNVCPFANRLRCHLPKAPRIESEYDIVRREAILAHMEEVNNRMEIDSVDTRKDNPSGNSKEDDPDVDEL